MAFCSFFSFFEAALSFFFLSAFFFGFGSSETPVQIFFPDVPNNVIVFPTGMIPLFLVPYAIFFHVLSGLSYWRHERGSPDTPGA